MKNIIIYSALFVLFSFAGIAKLLQITPDSVFLGKFETGAEAVFKTFELKNLINSTIVIKNSEFIQNDENQFFSDIRIPISIDITSSAKIQVKFSPTSLKPGVKKAKLLVLVREPEEERDTIIITAEITAPKQKGFTSLYIPDLSAKVGEQFELKLILNQFENKADLNRWVCKINFNASAMTPLSASQRGTIEFNRHTITVSGFVTNDLKSGDIMISIPMIAGLGDMKYSEISINEFTWFFNDKVIEHEIKTQNGIFELTGIYIENGIPRLITEKPINLNLDILENPANDYVRLNLNYQGEVKLFAYNIIGSFFYDFSSYVPFHIIQGPENIILNRQYFGSKGLYLIKIIGLNSSVSKLLFLE